MKQVTGRHSTRQTNNSAQDGNAPTDDTPLGTNPPQPEVSEVTSLIVPKKVPISKDGDQVLKVEMEQLVSYPPRGKLRGMVSHSDMLVHPAQSIMSL